MEDDASPMPTPIILRMPFMKTAKTNIDVYNGTLAMDFDGEVIHFNIFRAIRYPSDLNSCFSVDIIDSLAHEFFKLTSKDALEITIRKSLELEDSENLSINKQLLDNIEEIVASLKSLRKIPNKYNASFVSLPLFNEKLLPSVI